MVWGALRLGPPPPLFTPLPREKVLDDIPAFKIIKTYKKPPAKEKRATNHVNLKKELQLLEKDCPSQH